MHTDPHGFFLKVGSLSSSAVDFVGSCLDTCWALVGFRNGFTPIRRSSGAPEDCQVGAAMIRRCFGRGFLGLILVKDVLAERERN